MKIFLVAISREKLILLGQLDIFFNANMVTASVNPTLLRYGH